MVLYIQQIICGWASFLPVPEGSTQAAQGEKGSSEAACQHTCSLSRAQRFQCATTISATRLRCRRLFARRLSSAAATGHGPS